MSDGPVAQRLGRFHRDLRFGENDLRRREQLSPSFIATAGKDGKKKTIATASRVDNGRCSAFRAVTQPKAIAASARAATPSPCMLRHIQSPTEFPLTRTMAAARAFPAIVVRKLDLNETGVPQGRFLGGNHGGNRLLKGRIGITPLNAPVGHAHRFLPCLGEIKERTDRHDRNDIQPSELQPPVPQAISFPRGKHQAGHGRQGNQPYEDPQLPQTVTQTLGQAASHDHACRQGQQGGHGKRNRTSRQESQEQISHAEKKHATDQGCGNDRESSGRDDRQQCPSGQSQADNRPNGQTVRTSVLPLSFSEIIAWVDCMMPLACVREMAARGGVDLQRCPEIQQYTNERCRPSSAAAASANLPTARSSIGCGRSATRGGESARR